MNRYFLIMVVLILQTWIASADDTEKEMFLAHGYNWKHYEKAQKLNLDLENYTIFNSNKSNKIKGTVMMGVGGGFAGMGFIYLLAGALVSSAGENHNDNYSYYPYYEDDYDDDYDDEFTDFAKNVYFITGGLFLGTGVGLIAGGAVKHSKIGKVFTKSGTRLSLRPELDAINDRYGMRLSLSF